jgi:hypothetical protein
MYINSGSYAWRRPTLPGPCGPSTIGAGGLNGRVRDGYVWNPSAIATKRDFSKLTLLEIAARKYQSSERTCSLIVTL